MNSWKTVWGILKDELKKEIKDDFLEELKDVVKDVIKRELALMPEFNVNKEYMHMEDLLDEYKISRNKFHKCKKQNYFHSIQQGKYKVYHVEQFIQSLRNYKAEKPKFIR